MGKLYLVPTPIGNLGDITYRAVEVLSKVDTILAEDTRVTRTLAKHYQLMAPIHAWNDFQADLEKWIRELTHATIALVTDAGTPGISDPGYLLVKAALEAGIEVEVLPGPTAMIPALVGSGLPCDRFIFLGFLPKKPQDIVTLLTPFQESPLTLCYYDSPNRLSENLSTIATLYQNREVVVARELTKLHESWYRFTLDAIPSELSMVKGECVVVLGGHRQTNWTQQQLKDYLLTQKPTGPKKDIAKALAKQSGISSKKIYQLLLKS